MEQNCIKMRKFFTSKMAFISEVMRAPNYNLKCVFQIHTSDLTSTLYQSLKRYWGNGIQVYEEIRGPRRTGTETGHMTG
jgi:hypothetical protein